jgi:hypothetical protein
MRYLSLLFFIFLSLHSYFVFAQPMPICAPQSLKFANCALPSDRQYIVNACNTYSPSYVVADSALGSCSGEQKRFGCYTSCSCQDGAVINSSGVCACPAGTSWIAMPAAGANAGSCAPDSCPTGQKLNTIFGSNGYETSCIDDNGGTGEECPSGRDPLTGQCSNDDLCPSGYPKVNGQCPVCLEGQNEDGTCATPSSEPSSSTPNSSSPDTGSSGSAGSSGGGDGDGDGSGPGSGGGGDGGNGGNNGGGGSASAASASSVSGTGSSSGTNNSWNPYSGYGNWIPISENSPCPNKYQDISGQWWCAGGNSGNGSSSGNTGSAGSLASAGSSAGQCDPTSRDYLKCISSGNSSAQSNSSQSSSAGSNSSGATSSLGDKGEFDGEDAEKKLEEIQEDLSQKIEDIKTEIQNEFASAISGTGTIQDFCKNIRGSEVCFGMQKFESWLDPISQAIFLVSCVLSFAIVLGGRS